MNSQRWGLCSFAVVCLLCGGFIGSWAVRSQSTLALSGPFSVTGQDVAWQPPAPDAEIVSRIDSNRVRFDIDPDELVVHGPLFHVTPEMTFPSDPLRHTIHINHENDGAAQVAAVPQPEVVLEPQPLSVDAAVPIQDANRERDAMIRNLIEAEVPHATAQQKEVWFESLRDMSEQDVSGILRMWKMLAQPGETPVPVPPVIAAPAQPAAPAADLSRLVEQAVEIHRRNLRSRDVPGFVPHIPEIVEEFTADETARQSLRSTPVFSVNSKLRMTGFPLDLAIQGTGLFVVRSPDGETCYTRNGRFSLDEQRRLSLRVGQQTYVLQPEIVVDADLKGLEVDRYGQVVVLRGDDAGTSEQSANNPGSRSRAVCGRIELAWPLTPGVLQYQGAGLFRVPESEKDNLLVADAGSMGRGEIHFGCVEIPGVDPAGERAAIQSWRALLQE